jgi:nucleotidyltransferase substrate binding protein (TIGR01987 family)
MEEIYWKDYFYTLGRAIRRLKEVMEHPDLSKNDFMEDAAIQRFEFVTELFWKVLKKALAYEKVDTTTPRDVLNKAYQYSMIDDEDIWLKMLTDCNNTSHVYKEEDAKRVFGNIKLYLPVFEKTYESVKTKYKL